MAKNGIHPKYNRITVKCSTCGAEFETGSTAKELKVDTCSNCHLVDSVSQLLRVELKDSTKNTDLNKTGKDEVMIHFIFI